MLAAEKTTARLWVKLFKNSFIIAKKPPIYQFLFGPLLLSESGQNKAMGRSK